ncbi:MAG: amidohydrolase family protein [Acidimicrobiia bacterium]
MANGRHAPMPITALGLAALTCLAGCSASVVETTSTVAATTTTFGRQSTSTVDTTSTTTAPVDVAFADMVITGGPVLTMAASIDAEGVAVRGDEIVAVGSADELQAMIGPETELLDLEGRALIPGFVDAHAHYYGAALSDGQTPAATQDLMLTAGVTTVGELAVDPELLAEMQRLDSEGLIRVRTSAYLLADTACGDRTGDWQFEFPPTRGRGELFRIGGIKLFTDGGSCNAPAVSYEHAFGGNGDLYFDAAEIAALITPYDEAGYQVAVHAIGDRAVEATLDGLEMVIGDSGNPNRHRIEHNAVVRPETRDRYDEVGAVAVIFGSFGTCAYLGRDDRFRFATPIANQEWEWPWRDLLDLNPETVFAWHGDYPVFHDSRPLTSLSGFVTRAQTLEDGTHCDPEPYHIKHAITVEEALGIMTMGSAYALDRDTEVGSIEVGKLADLVVLSEDPRTVPPEELIDLSVELTILGGAPAFCGEDLADICDGAGRAIDRPQASMSLPASPPELAVDGDVETGWGSGSDAPQWIEIPLGEERSVSVVTLVVDQYPAGPTTHLVWGRTSSGDLVKLAEVSEDTDMFDVLEIEVEDTTPVVAIRIETTESPSWVSWREIEVG